jgi:hypothetical protein
MRALLISCLCLAVAARPKMRPADDREEATVGGGAEDTDEDMVHNWETKDPVLRGWANMQVCLDNIRYSQATLTEGTSVAGSFADKLAGRVKGLLDLGAPLHQSFLWNINTLQSTLFRVIWTMSTLYASPYFNLLSKASDVYAAPPPASSATRPPPLPTPAPPPPAPPPAPDPPFPPTRRAAWPSTRASS